MPTYDAYDPTTPADTDLAKYQAAQLRAVKAALVSLRDTGTSQAAQIADLIDELGLKLSQVELVGSGNFTVPAGVTRLYILAVGGGQSGCTVALTATGQTSCWYPPTSGKLVLKALTVTPGQVISYSVGASGVPAVTYEVTYGIGPSAVIRQSIVASATSFGAVTTGVPYIEPVRFGEQPSGSVDWELNGIVPTYGTYNTAVLDRTKSATPNYPLPKLVHVLYSTFNVAITPPDTTPILLVGW